MRRRELWRVAAEWLTQAQDDATLLALRDQEAAGLDLVTDGEIRRESYSNRFATALEGIDLEQMGTAVSRIGRTVAFMARLLSNGWTQQARAIAADPKILFLTSRRRALIRSPQMSSTD